MKWVMKCLLKWNLTPTLKLVTGEWLNNNYMYVEISDGNKQQKY